MGAGRSKYNETSSPPAAAADTRMKLRRFRLRSFSILSAPRIVPPSLFQLLRRALDGLTNPHIDCASAYISTHRFFYICVSRFRRRFQQRDGAHDLSTLTITTLNDIFFHPSFLHRSTYWICADAFNRYDRPISNQRDRHYARAGRYSGNVHGARTASTNAATVRSEERRVGKECRSRWSPYH